MNLLCLVCDKVAAYIMNGHSVCMAESCLEVVALTSNGERIYTHKKYLQARQAAS